MNKKGLGKLASLSLLALWAGVFSNSADASCGGVTTVANETELGAAISAFNAETDANCVFTISLSGDIALTQNLPDIFNGISMIIEGNGFTVDGQDIAGVRPFAVQPSTTVTMNDLTVTGGNMSGGGFSNKGGGIMNRGTLTLNRVTVSGNKMTPGTGNNQALGGGIANSGTLTINQSTISHNVLSWVGTGDGHVGGGIYAEGDGSQITIINSTLSNNTRQALYIAGGNVTLDSATITENGYGLYVAESNSIPHTITLGNSILANNGPELPDHDCYFPIQGATRVLNDRGFNLISRSDNNCGIVGGQHGNITGQDPLLDVLADNGGPTQTHAPLLGSPILDAGATLWTVDQRGHPRPLGPASDIGAYEDVQCLGTDTWTVSTVDEWHYAIDCFNTRTTAGTYTIQFVHGFGMPGSSPLIDNNTAGVSLLIDGNGQELEGGGLIDQETRLLEIAQDTTVTVQDLTMQNGSADHDGGAILNRGNLTVRRSTIWLSYAGDRGSAAFNTSSGVMLIEDSTIQSNDWPVTGTGTLYNDGGDLTIRNSTISDNDAKNISGIASFGGSLELDSVTVTNNESTVTNDPAVYYDSNTTATITNSIFSSNIGVADIVCAAPPAGDHNLAQTQQNCFTNGVNGNIVGQDPLLGPLANNGGPTRTHALQDTSPAYNTGATTLTTDQRGHPRPSGAADDMGAFELDSTGTLTIHKMADPADGRDFDFTLSGGNLGAPVTFQLDWKDKDAVKTLKTLILEAGVGQYTVTEAESGQMGTRLISCSDANGPRGSVAGNTLTLDLQLHEAIDCTFFNEEWYSIDAAAVGNGTVSCSPTQVWKGQSSICTALPNPGFRVREWTGDCVGAGSNTQCFLGKITKDQSSEVVFEGIPLDTFSVTANVVQGSGTVSCTPTSVASGGSSTCTAVPADGYQVESWGGACAAWGSNTECYLSKIKSDQVSTVGFALLPPTTFAAIVTVDGIHGSVVCTPTNVALGGTMTCTATPDIGYRVAAWSGACAAAGNDPVCVLTDVDGNQLAAVRFALIPPPIPALAPWGLALLGLLMLGVARRGLGIVDAEKHR